MKTKMTTSSCPRDRLRAERRPTNLPTIQTQTTTTTSLFLPVHRHQKLLLRHKQPPPASPSPAPRAHPDRLYLLTLSLLAQLSLHTQVLLSLLLPVHQPVLDTLVSPHDLHRPECTCRIRSRRADRTGRSSKAERLVPSSLPYPPLLLLARLHPPLHLAQAPSSTSHLPLPPPALRPLQAARPSLPRRSCAT